LLSQMPSAGLPGSQSGQRARRTATIVPITAQYSTRAVLDPLDFAPRARAPRARGRASDCKGLGGSGHGDDLCSTNQGPVTRQAFDGFHSLGPRVGSDPVHEPRVARALKRGHWLLTLSKKAFVVKDGEASSRIHGTSVSCRIIGWGCSSSSRTSRRGRVS